MKRIKDFMTFVNEGLTNDFELFSKDFEGILQQIDGVISDLFLDNKNNDELGFSFVDVDGDKYVTYLRNKDYDGGDPYNNSSRQKATISTIVKKLLNATGNLENVDNSDINEFISDYLSLSAGSGTEVKVLSGSEIVEYFLTSDVVNAGDGNELSLANLQSKSRKNGLRLYTSNPQSVKLIVVIKNGKLAARSLLWRIEDTDDMYVDRIYAADNRYRGVIKNYATDNGYLLYGKDDVEDLVVYLLPDRSYSEFPYMDTFHYYQQNTGKLAASEYVLDEDEGKIIRI
jgi:hypothetical protein